MKYAEQTTVSSERSRAEIETILGRYGASSFAYMWQGTTALILFEYNGKRIKFMLRLPSRDDKAIKCTPERGTVRSREAQEKAYKQAVRQKWRALTLVIKAKLKAEGVSAGVPDLFIPIPKQGYHGLFVEMKVGKNRTSPEQDEWLALLRKNGYRAAVCYGADAAIKTIDDYIMG